MRLELSFDSSLTPQWLAKGQGVQFQDREGRPILRYSGLVVWDAVGHKLDAKIVSLDNGLTLQIDDQSAVYPVTIDPTIINESAKLLASDGAANDDFVWSVAIGGDTIVVGALLHDDIGPDSGAAYVFVKPAGGWTGTLNESAKLLASDGAENDIFGYSVAIAGDTIVVGATLSNDKGDDSGSAYVFVKPTGGWMGTLNESTKLIPTDGAAGARFGWNVAIEGNTVVVGAFLDDANESDSGSAYVLTISPPNASPVCTAAQAFPSALWQPNNQFVPIAIMGVTDPDRDSVTITVTGVKQDEPVKGGSAGPFSPDAVIQGGTASVRAERNGTGNGRVYQLSFRAEDGRGRSCTGTVTVGVPHSLQKGITAIDDGQIYNSTIP